LSDMLHVKFIEGEKSEEKIIEDIAK